jgi:hypothetical protein
MTVKVHNAIFDRDTATFLSMSPKYIINWKDEKIEGKPAEDGGKTPTWESAHKFNVGTDLSSAGVLSFTFFDDSSLICEAASAVSDLA